jgi:hypothetical protein
MSNVKAFVSEAASARIVVQVIDEEVLETLKNMGFTLGDDKKLVLTASALSQEAKAEMLSKLRDCGICFSGGPDWSPSEVFEYLRDRGLLTGRYRKVIWRGPSQMDVIEDV